MKKMAFVDLTNFKDWPMGGMLQYELKILPALCQMYDVDLWGVSVDNKKNNSLEINGKQYPIYTWANAKTDKRLIPNYLKGLQLFNYRKEFKKYDIIYAHTATCLLPFYSFKKKGIKIVYHQHGLMYLEDKSLKTNIQKPFMKKAQEASDLTFVVSGPKSVQAYSKKLNSHGKLIAVNSPIDFSVENKDLVENKIKKEKPSNFIYTGRLTKFKNVASLIPIFRNYLNRIDSNAKLTIVGDGEEKKYIQDLIDKYNLNKSIILTGKLPHSEIKKKLIENDIFLMPSKGEGVSVSVAEANSLGLPVICYDVPGLNEQILSGINGYIAKENKNDFYEKILKTTINWKELVLSSFEYSKKFAISKVTNVIIENIEEL